MPSSVIRNITSVFQNHNNCKVFWQNRHHSANSQLLQQNRHTIQNIRHTKHHTNIHTNINMYNHRETPLFSNVIHIRRVQFSNRKFCKNAHIKTDMHYKTTDSHHLSKQSLKNYKLQTKQYKIAMFILQ